MRKVLLVLTDILLLLLLPTVPLLSSVMIDRGPECFFFKHGIICPTCGGTRCVHAFFTGDFSNAARYNFSVFCGLILGSVFMILLNIHVFFEIDLCAKMIRLFLHPVTLMLLAVAYLVSGLLRNFL